MNWTATDRLGARYPRIGFGHDQGRNYEVPSRRLRLAASNLQGRGIAKKFVQGSLRLVSAGPPPGVWPPPNLKNGFGRLKRGRQTFCCSTKPSNDWTWKTCGHWKKHSGLPRLQHRDLRTIAGSSTRIATHILSYEDDGKVNLLRRATTPSSKRSQKALGEAKAAQPTGYVQETCLTNRRTLATRPHGGLFSSRPFFFSVLITSLPAATGGYAANRQI